MFLLESPQRGDSNEYTQYTISQYKKKIILNYPKSATMGPKNEFETSLVNELSVFEPLKFYYAYHRYETIHQVRHHNHERNNVVHRGLVRGRRPMFSH